MSAVAELGSESGGAWPLDSAASNHLKYALEMIQSVCRLAGSFSLIDDIRQELAADGVLDAVNDNNSERLFDWLVAILSLQGISDAVANSFMDRHGRLSHQHVAKSLQAEPSCPKLQSYWHFDKCG